MRRVALIRAIRATWVVLLLLASPASYAADEYWEYSYRDIDVTAVGNGAYASNLARSCIQLDVLLSRILGIRTPYRPPTHIYSMPAAQLKKFTGLEMSATYNSSGYENTVLIDSAGMPGRRYWGAYFGYTATLLASDRQLRGPDWYRVGVPEVFADTVFEGGHAQVGNITPVFAYTLGRGALIPMRTFLGMTQQEAEAKGESYFAMYDAEAWFLAREIFIEGKHRAEFTRYLDLLRAGTVEPAAFAASFTISYENLDKELVHGMGELGHRYVMDIPEAPAITVAPQRLSPAEVQARFALAAVRYGKGPDPVQLADAALQLDGTNETALRALALAQLKRNAYAEALAAVDRLSAQGESVGAYGDSAEVLAVIAGAAASGTVTLPVDAATLRSRARDDYQRVLAVDGEDRRAQDGLKRLTSSP
jgi:hypothetical protein